MPVSVRMVAPDGRDWIAGSPTEVTDLLAQGYQLAGAGASTPTSATDVDDVADEAARPAPGAPAPAAAPDVRKATP